MGGASEEYAIFVVPLVLVLGFALGALNGALIVVTRVPDIVVTLAMLFVLQGAALLRARTRRAARRRDWLKARDRRHGAGAVACPTTITAWIPEGAGAAGRLPRPRLDPAPALAARPVASTPIGSSELAAFRSGVPVARTQHHRLCAVGGLFAAMGGLSLTMSTGIGAPIPGPYLPASVAAVVLGGVALGGGARRARRTDRRRLRAAAGAHRPDLARRSIPTSTAHHRRRDHGRGGDARRLPRHARTAGIERDERQRLPTAHRSARPPPPKRFMADYPLVPLIAAPDPADRGAADHAARHRQRALDRQHDQVRHPARHPRRLPDHDHADRRHRPLGRHRGHHGAVHHRARRRCTTIRPSRWRSPWCPAVLIGLANGIGVGIFRVHPLIMTLGTGLIGTGCLQVYQRTVIATGTEVPAWPRLARHRADLRRPERAAAVHAGRRASSSCLLGCTGFGRLLYAVGDNERRGAALRRALLAGDHRALFCCRACSPASPACSISA